MDSAHFMGFCFLGFGVALPLFYLLGPTRRAKVPIPLWWLSLLLGFPITFYGWVQSTTPSFSTPITAVGKAYDYVGHEDNRRFGTSYGEFRFVPEGGKSISIETEITLPDWRSPADFDGRTFRVVYLNDSGRFLKNEAIDISILSGTNTGFHDSLDARPLGSWLWIPVGMIFFGLGNLSIRNRTKDGKYAEPDDGADPATTPN